MFRYTFRYLFVPAICLFITMSLYKFINKKLQIVDEDFVKKTEQVATSGTGEATDSGEALIGGPFTLLNQNGEQVSDSQFRGKLMLVYFGFTHCPDVCPTDMAIMTQAMSQLGADAEKVQPIFISIDPERDDVAQVRSFAASFYPTLQALTGTPEQIAQVSNAYRIYAKKVESAELSGYVMDHSAYMYLMGKDGKYITHFRHGQLPDEIVAGIKKNL